MSYYVDRGFDDPRKMIDFFIHDPEFRSVTPWSAIRPGLGLGGYIFRGQSDARNALLSSAFRIGSLKNFTHQPPDDKIDPANLQKYLDRHLLAEVQAVNIFMDSADSLGIPTPVDYSTTKDELERMVAMLSDKEGYYIKQPFPSTKFQRATALAQHYGVPTRFLDWTESPLVASYFAAIGASSFSTMRPTKDQEISVVFMHAGHFSAGVRYIELIRAPRHENTNLRQQQGVFTNILHANTFFMEHGRWPALEDFSEPSSNAGNLQLNRVRLPAALADSLLKALYDLKITRHSMTPSLATAARAYEYARILFQSGLF